MDEPLTDYRALLKALRGNDVDLIVVGGVCAALHGAPINTFDLDVVHSRDPENLDRLVRALESIDAYYRGRGEQRIRPVASHLASTGHHLLMTEQGPLDLLDTVGSGQGYEELLVETEELEVEGFPVHILRLEALVRLKEASTHPKDQVVLPILRRVLEERDRL